MQITVFGASGKVGRQVVTIALERGYTVKAFVHSRNPFSEHPALHVIHGDILDRSAVLGAVQGSEVIISALGSWGSKNKTVVSEGTRAIIAAMEHSDIKRLITVSGAAAVWRGDKLSILAKFWRILFGLAAPKILKDGEAHLRLLDASQLDWTCVRSPAMTNDKDRGYKLSDETAPIFATIPRAAVAKSLVDQISDKSLLQKATTIHRS